MTMPVEYACIKSGIISLTKYIAKYYKGYNIRANCISPGGIYNNQPEEFVRKYNSYCLNKGMLNKEDINGTLIFLLSDMSKYINGQNIVIDDGFSL
jgi:NAD(P)-dependent dehydrogenase (short-subunit alcohol dehydrogenase family)